MPDSNLVGAPIVVAFITEHPKIYPQLDYNTINCTGFIMMTGSGLIGHDKFDVLFDPPLVAGVDYEFESQLPLIENLVVLKTLPGRRWRTSSGPLRAVGVNVPRIQGISQFRNPVLVAVVQCGLYLPEHTIEVTMFSEDDLTIYHDQRKMAIQGKNLRPPFEFSNGMQPGVNYSFGTVSTEEVVLKLMIPSFWSSDCPERGYPHRLRLLSAGTENQQSVALGVAGVGIVVAVVFQRPTAAQSFIIPIIQQSNTKVVYIEGSGFVNGFTQLSFVPPMPPSSYSITVMSSNLLEVALTMRSVWKGSGNAGKVGLGYLYLNGISSRGESGWHSLAPSAYHEQGVLIGNVVPDIVDFGHVLPLVTEDRIGGKEYIMENKYSSMLPIDDPFEWSKVDMPYELSVSQMSAIAIVGVKNSVIMALIDSHEDSVDGIYSRAVVLPPSGFDQLIGGMTWSRSHLDLSVSEKIDSRIAKLSVSVDGKHLAAIMPGRSGYFVSFTYGENWEHRPIPAASAVPSRLRGTQAQDSVVNDVAISAHGSLLAAICSSSGVTSLSSGGGTLYVSSSFGNHWMRVDFSRFKPASYIDAASIGVVSVAVGGDGMFMVASLKDSSQGYSMVGRSWSYGQNWDIIENKNGFVCKQILFASPANSRRTASGGLDPSDAYNNDGSIDAATLSSLNVLCIDYLGRLWHSDSFGIDWSKAGAVDGENANTDSGDCTWDHISAGRLGGYVAASATCVKNGVKSELICISVNMGRTFSPLSNAPGDLIMSKLSLSAASDHLIVGSDKGLFIGSVDDSEGFEEFGEPDANNNAAKAPVLVHEPISRNISTLVQDASHTPSQAGVAAAALPTNTVLPPVGVNFTVTRHSEFRTVTHKRYYYAEPAFRFSQGISRSLDWSVRRMRISCLNSLLFSATSSQFLCASHDRTFLTSTSMGRNWDLFQYDGSLDPDPSDYPALLWIVGSKSFAHLTACFVPSSEKTSHVSHCTLYASADMGHSWHKAGGDLEPSHYYAFKASVSGQYQIGLAKINKVRKPDVTGLDISVQHRMPTDISFNKVDTAIHDTERYAELMDATFGPGSVNLSAVPVPVDDRIKSGRSNVAARFQVVMSNNFGETFASPLVTYSTIAKSFMNEEQLSSASIAISDHGFWIYVAIPYAGIMMTSDFGEDGWKDSFVGAYRWRDLACSKNGKYVVGAFGHSRSSDRGVGPHGGIYVSSDYGASWDLATAPNYWYERVVVASSGLLMVATTINCDRALFIPCLGRHDVPSSVSVYVSTNFGHNWTLSKRLGRQMAVGNTFLSVDPQANRMIVYSRTGELFSGVSIEADSRPETYVYSFHYNLHIAQLSSGGDGVVFHVFGSGFANREVVLNFETGLYDRKIAVRAHVINDYELDIKITRTQDAVPASTSASTVAMNSGIMTAISYRLLSVTVSSADGSVLPHTFDVNVDAILTVLPDPGVAPGHTILHETSNRELRILGNGFVGPVCMVYLDPTPFGVYDCTILSNHVLQISLKDDNYGYSDALGWLGVQYHWPYEMDRVPLQVHLYS
jgi:hypothetical protein